MALITSDRGTNMLTEDQMALITSGCGGQVTFAAENGACEDMDLADGQVCNPAMHRRSPALVLVFFLGGMGGDWV